MAGGTETGGLTGANTRAFFFSLCNLRRFNLFIKPRVVEHTRSQEKFVAGVRSRMNVSFKFFTTQFDIRFI